MEYQICTRCVMDSSDTEIVFDKDGVCNHCKDASKKLTLQPYSLPSSQKQALLNSLVEKIKKESVKTRYDCIIGLSGGVDSSYVALLVRELGLRPLAIHLDNGWNSEIAVSNIHNICNILNIDLFTHVIDWDLFKNMQLSFLKASTPDSEIPSDHAIYAILYEQARKYGIKYIISGSNLATEAILPTSWSQGHNDWHYIKSVCMKNGVRVFKSFPHYSVFKLFYYKKILGINWVSLLDYYEYNKEDAKSRIAKEVNWKDYGRKHGESVYTKIFQEYILPLKFGYDKRRAHYSSLIVAGQMTRAEALKMLEEPLYLTKNESDEDVSYLCLKFGITHSDFEAIMKEKPKTMNNYPNQNSLWYIKLAKQFYQIIKGRK